MKSKILILAAFVLLVLLALPASAEIALGTRTYGNFESIGTFNTVASAVDWLESYLRTELPSTTYSSENLQYRTALIEKYGLQTAFPGGAEAFEEKNNSCKVDVVRAADLKSQMCFSYNRLNYIYNQSLSLRSSIASGEYSAVEIDKMKRELDRLMAEGSDLVSSVSLKSNNTWTENSLTLRAQFSAGNDYVEAIRALSEPLLRAEEKKLRQAEASTYISVVNMFQHAVVVRTMEDDLPVVPADGDIYVEISFDGCPTRRIHADAGGAVYFDVSDFLPDEDGLIMPHIRIEDDNHIYRTVDLGNIIIKGGTATQLMISKDDGSPYLVGATFDGEDMLRIGNSAFSARGNTADHTVRVLVDTKNRDCTLDFTQRVNASDEDYVLLRSENISGSSTVQTVTWTDKWLQNGAGVLDIQNGGVLGLALDWKKGALRADPDAESNISVLSYELEESAVDEPVSTSSVQAVPLMGSISIALPSKIPLIGGATFSMPLDNPGVFSVEPDGSIQFGFNYKMRTPKMGWMNESARARCERIGNMNGDSANSMEKYINGVTDDIENAGTQKQFLASATAYWYPYGFVRLSHECEGRVLQNLGGTFRAGIGVGANVNLSFDFWAGPVPIALGLNLDGSICVGGQLAVEADLSGDSIKLHLVENAQTSGLQIRPDFKLSLTGGVGNSRIAYLGVVFKGWFNMDIYINAKAYGSLDVGCGFFVKLKLLFFSKEWEIKTWGKQIDDLFNTKAGFQDYAFMMALEGAPEAPGPVVPVMTAAKSFCTAPSTAYLNAEEAEETVIGNLGTLLSEVQYVNIEGENGEETLAFWIGYDEDRQYSSLYWYAPDTEYPEGAAPQALILEDTEEDIRSDDGFKVVDYDVDSQNGRLYVILELGEADFEFSGDTEIVSEEEYEENVFGVDTLLMSGVFEFTSDGSVNPELKQVCGFVNDADFGPVHNPKICAFVEPIEGAEYAIAGVMRKQVRDIHLKPHETYCVLNCVPQLGQKMGLDELDPTDSFAFKKDDYMLPEFELLDFTCLCDDVLEEKDRIQPVCIASAEKRNTNGPADIEMRIGAYDESYIIDNANFNSFTPVRTAYRTKDGISKRIDCMMLVSRGEDAGMNNGNTATFSKVNIMFFSENMKHGISASDLCENIRFKNVDVPTNATMLNTATVYDPHSADPEAVQRYLYWCTTVDSNCDECASEPETEYRLMACLVDVKNEVVTPAFQWTTLDKSAYNVNLRFADQSSSEVIGDYVYNEGDERSNASVEIQGLQRKKFKLGPAAQVTAVATSEAAILQGDQFDMTFRLKNTGPLVLTYAKIDVVATNVAKPDEEPHLIKGIYANFLRPASSRIVHYDFTVNGDILVTRGEHTVYRTPDVMDEYDGQHPYISEYQPDGKGGMTLLKADERTISGLLPGTYSELTAHMDFNTAEWNGTYRLDAYVSEAGFTMGDQCYAVSRSGENGLVTSDPSSALILGVSDRQHEVAADAFAVAPLMQQTAAPGDTHVNDILLSADTILHEGKYYASISMFNHVYQAADKKVIPVLVAMVDGVETYRQPLKTELNDAYSRCTLIPVDTLTGGRETDRVFLRVEGLNGDYDEICWETNEATLRVRADFDIVRQPEDIVVNEGTQAVFEAEAAGATGPFSYQWFRIYPDGTEQIIKGATERKLSVPDCIPAWSGMRVRCEITDSHGRTRTTREALLTVIVVPDTGVREPRQLMIVMSAMAALALIILIRIRRRNF